MCIRDRIEGASAGLFGDRIHIVVAARDEAIAQIKQVLVNENLTLHGIREIEPSLEDVFVSVLAARKEATENA